MSAEDGGPAEFPWLEFAVTAAVYIAGVYLLLVVLEIDVFQLGTQPQGILMVLFLVPLIPVLIVLALTGRIKGFSIGGFVEVILREPDDGRPSLGRRPILKAGLFTAVIAVLGILIENVGPSRSPTSPSTDRPTDTLTRTATSAREETTSAPEADYGERAYGQDDYGS